VELCSVLTDPCVYRCSGYHVTHLLVRLVRVTHLLVTHLLVTHLLVRGQAARRLLLADGRRAG